MSYICKVAVTLCPPIARLSTHSMVFLSVARINPEKWLQRIKLWRFSGDTSARHCDKLITMDCFFNYICKQVNKWLNFLPITKTVNSWNELRNCGDKVIEIPFICIWGSPIVSFHQRGSAVSSVELQVDTLPSTAIFAE